ALVPIDLEAQRGKAKGKAKAAAPPEDTGPPPMSVPPTYKYDRKGRRDPFVDPTPKAVKGQERGEEKPVIPPAEQRPPGMKGLLLQDVVITAVVAAKDPSMSVAMISAPGGKRYFAHQGDALFDAVIKEIRPDGVLFVQSVPGRSSNTPPREIERKVRRTR
ncbi:MAG: hypothetical protein HY646_16645, partial [Acidobacteria bacterium]|nr:hypothetical protein [Acidobacteriota bacterium]